MRGQAMRTDALRGPGTPYEVRCHRCDVSFPVETRRCIHCGGPTAAAGQGITVTAFTGTVEAPTGSIPAPHAPEPISAGGSDESGVPGGKPAPQSVGAALLRSFGSLFWIIALIGFSLAKNCSEG